MLKRIAGCTASSARPTSGTSWTRMATSPARAIPGAASAHAAARAATSFSTRTLSASMKRLLTVLFLLTLAVPAHAAAAAPRVLAIHFTADVDPVTQDWVNNQLGNAESGGYSAAVIVLDTPGGLEESMRKIMQK